MSHRNLTTLCLVATLCFPALAAPPQTLNLSDLVNHPERWPATVTLKKDFRFGGGHTAQAGQQVAVFEFNGRQVGVDAGNDLYFGVSPNDCDLLEAANKAWALLTPDQRAVDTAMLLNDASIWPARVKCITGFTLDNGQEIDPDGEFDLLAVNRDGVVLFSKEHQTRLIANVAQTDVIARARRQALIEPAQRPSRVADALRGVLVNTEGKPATPDTLDTAQVFALYYGASWCGPCRQFSPGFVRFIDKVGPQNPRLVVVLISNDEEDAAMYSYMRSEKMPWPAAPLAAMKNSPILLSYTQGSIPQLAVVDRYGKLIADAYINGRYVGPKHPMGVLAKLLDTGVAR